MSVDRYQAARNSCSDCGFKCNSNEGPYKLSSKTFRPGVVKRVLHDGDMPLSIHSQSINNCPTRIKIENDKIYLGTGLMGWGKFQFNKNKIVREALQHLDTPLEIDSLAFTITSLKHAFR